MRRRNHTPVTIRRLDGEEIVVSGPAFDRLNERRERARITEAAKTRSQLEAKQALFVLQPGDLITVDATGDDVWWYVMKVNGPTETVTARTIIFERRLQRVWPFAVIKRVEPDDPWEANDWRLVVGFEPQREPDRYLSDAVTTDLLRHYDDLLRIWPRRPCHGYANACVCDRCVTRDVYQLAS